MGVRGVRDACVRVEGGDGWERVGGRRRIGAKLGGWTSSEPGHSPVAQTTPNAKIEIQVEMVTAPTVMSRDGNPGGNATGMPGSAGLGVIGGSGAPPAAGGGAAILCWGAGWVLRCGVGEAARRVRWGEGETRNRGTHGEVGWRPRWKERWRGGWGPGRRENVREARAGIYMLWARVCWQGAGLLRWDGLSDGGRCQKRSPAVTWRKPSIGRGVTHQSCVARLTAAFWNVASGQ